MQHGASTLPDELFHRFRDVHLTPRPVQRPIPIVVGGRTVPAFRRAVTQAQGWYGYGLDLPTTQRFVEGLREEEHRLTIAAPAEWRIETQLAREDEQTFLARDYDHLIDSPTIAAAVMTRHSFIEEGARIHLIFRGDEGIDTEQFIEPVRAITRAQAKLFGGLPFREYRFLYHVREKWHGVEHEESCSIIVRRDALLGAKEGDEGYEHLLSITAHELFHVWNVKRIVPAKFHPYDYWRETPTRLLWAMEGITSYYGDLSLRRAGIWSVERYVDHLRKVIETLEGLPARFHLPLSQASAIGVVP